MSAFKDSKAFKVARLRRKTWFDGLLESLLIEIGRLTIGVGWVVRPQGTEQFFACNRDLRWDLHHAICLSIGRLRAGFRWEQNDKLTPLPPRAPVERAEGNRMANKHEAESGAAVAGAAPCSAITLTIAEITDLVKFSGLQLMEEPTTEEGETEITVQSWPEKGVRDADGVTMLPPHKWIAYYEDYPEEGCVPLGSPNAKHIRDDG